MPPRKKSFVTIQILPEGSGEAWTFRLRRPFFEFLFYAFVVALFAAGFAAVKLTQIQGKVLLAGHMAERNQELQAQQRKMSQIERELVMMAERERSIRNILQAFLSDGPDPARVATAPAWTGRDMTAFFENLRAIDRQLEEGDEMRAREREPNIWPVKGIISQRFSPGTSTEPRHDGIDILAEANAVVVSAARGMVTEQGWDNDFGLYVRISHDIGIETLYGHLARVFVKPGDQVGKGGPIGTVGSTGRSLGPHLHFEIIFRGHPVDPLLYLE